MGPPNVQPVPEITGNELSDRVIAEQPLYLPPTTPEWPMPTFNVTDLTTQADIIALQEAGWTPVGRGFPTQQLAENEPVADVFEDLGDVFVDWVRGEVLDPQPQYNQPVGSPTATPVAAPGGPGIPPNMQQTCTTSCGPSPVWKKVCGVYKWVIPKRRRRRALLTEGDYNALLRIEGLKVNKNMTAAIAKALTRG